MLNKILLFLTLISISSCGVKLGRNDREKRNLPSVIMQDFVYAFTEDSGYREWEVKSAQAKIFEDNNIVYLYNLTMTFFSESNQIQSVLIANKGIVNQNSRNLQAEGEVYILSSNQSQLITEKVYWDQERKLFFSETNKLVTFIRPTQKILGYNMITDSELNNIELDNSIGQIEVGDRNENNTLSNNNVEMEFFEQGFTD